MKFRWLRFLPVLMTALWLPIQALTAFVMPLALLAAPDTAQATDVVVASADIMPCHGHGVVADPDDGPLKSPQDECQRCDACHLACVGYLPVTQGLPSFLCGQHVLAGPAMRTLSTRFLEPLDHPPRLTA